MVKLIQFFTRHPSLVLLSSVSLAIVYWLLEAYIHTRAFLHGTFLSNIWPNDPNELWMRGVTTFFILIFGYFAYRYQVEIAKMQRSLLIDNVAINHMRESVMVTSADNIVLKINPAFTRVTGYEADEMIGQNPRILQSSRQDADFYKDMWKTMESTGKWEGEMWNRRKSGDIYPEWLSISRVVDPNHPSVVLCHVAVFTDITMRKEDESRLAYYAYYDPLTNLPNRRFLLNSAEQLLRLAARKKSITGVLFVDVDKFKEVNDTHGHDAGDALLIALGQWMRNFTRESDVVARMGGDEFVILLVETNTIEETEALAKKMLAEIVSKVVTVDDKEIRPQISIGGAVYPRDGQDIESLLKVADGRVYLAKKATSIEGKVVFSDAGASEQKN